MNFDYDHYSLLLVKRIIQQQNISFTKYYLQCHPISTANSESQVTSDLDSGILFIGIRRRFRVHIL